jgi:hypothetical protein
MNLELGVGWILYTTSFIRKTAFYPGPPMKFGAWAITLLCGLGDRATLCRPRDSPRSWPVCFNEFHPVTGQLQVLVGIILDVV